MPRSTQSSRNPKRLGTSSLACLSFSEHRRSTSSQTALPKQPMLLPHVAILVMAKPLVISLPTEKVCRNGKDLSTKKRNRPVQRCSRHSWEIYGRWSWLNALTKPPQPHVLRFVLESIMEWISAQVQAVAQQKHKHSTLPHR